MSQAERFDEDAIQILAKLKIGSTLTKRKRNGEKYSRCFFLDEHEAFISYHQSEKVFSQSHRCKFFLLISPKLLVQLFVFKDYIHKINEVRVGFHTRTFDQLVRRDLIEKNDVKKTN